MMMEAFEKTDPEFAAIWKQFAENEVVTEENQQVEDSERYLAILAALIGCQGLETYKLVLLEALEHGLTPVMVKETVYQAADYMGLGRMLPFLTSTNEILEKKGIALPLPPQAVTTQEDRREKGTQVQVEIFGEGMRDFWKNGHINRWLAANCFGDYYTRTGLDLRQRELITFCFLAGQGGCEPQLTSHAAGNMNLGNDKEFLLRIVSQCLPYLGYPRSLNAINCIHAADKSQKK